MSACGEALAAAGLALVGSPFRLHGRDPATGLDCVGLVHAGLLAVGVQPVTPRGYGLRNLGVGQWLGLAQNSGLVPFTGPHAAGDVLLIALAHCQHHLVIVAGEGDVIHAHAGLRKVVRQPFDPAWQVCAHWRLAPTAKE
ncbi:NlpC/P60 family protein [Erythrobacter donghaensis]|uniref:NlpC/P60 family protein n=1 Tax=Erythrobacter donghaensis TaxID=267135 RepID=UPI000A3BFB1C|nr:NlpC/P60 family protein [Erythrobacter donghaensis]